MGVFTPVQPATLSIQPMKMKSNQYLSELFDRYINKTCTDSEKQELMQLLADPSYEAQWNAINESFENVPQLQYNLDQDNTKSVWEAINNRTSGATGSAPVKPLYRRWWAAAAALVLIAGAAWFLWLKSEEKIIQMSVVLDMQDSIMPGQAGAILKLDDGRVIVLDSVQNGTITSKAIVENGALTYKSTDAPSTGDEVYNTMVTMRGKQYKMTLPDGTRVWLNASTQLRYPVAFHGKERRVQLSGEAYFEVAQNQSQPFIVDVQNKGAVQVLGTQFNVNAYPEDSRFITTLLEGKVQLNSAFRDSKGNKQQTILEPSYQSIMQPNKDIVLQRADMEQTMAWKEGKFVFKSARLSDVFNQLGRWYDVNFVNGENVDAAFSGSMYRTDNFYELLKLIEFTSNVNCKVEGRTVIVTSKS